MLSEDAKAMIAVWEHFGNLRQDVPKDEQEALFNLVQEAKDFSRDEARRLCAEVPPDQAMLRAYQSDGAG